MGKFSAKTINDILKNLSKEELELHKNLIKECQQREQDIQSASKITQKEIARWALINKDILLSIHKIDIAIKKLSEVSKNKLCQQKAPTNELLN